MTYAVGDTAPSLTKTVTRADIARYAGASGDFNRPHVDPEFATEEAGYDSVIAMGMLTGGLAGTVAHEWFGTNALRRFETRFEDVVVPGDEVTVTGEIVAVDGSTVEATLEATTADGRTALTGRITATV